MVNKKNPFAFKAKQETKKKSGGKRIGKSKPDKANNQLNRRVEVNETIVLLQGKNQSAPTTGC